jgi:hypothetical protein
VFYRYCGLVTVMISSCVERRKALLNKLGLLIVPMLLVIPVTPQQPDWQVHANWCANVDNGSSHRVYLNTCHSSDQYDSVLACQRDAGRNNGDGGKAVAAIETAGRQQVNQYMENNKPRECVSSHGR